VWAYRRAALASSYLSVYHGKVYVVDCILEQAKVVIGEDTSAELVAMGPRAPISTLEGLSF
jgi:hypothetical protein